ncbi:MAG: DUF481 domain-containing protein [Gemmatimonadetes bacterium]|nr:DUF481 domain-containing protein [Gemmatimonadota bacterium]
MPPNTLRRFSIVLGILFGAAASPADAQDAPNLWRSQLEFGFNGSSGNSSFGILRTGGSLTRIQTDVYEFEISALVRYGKSEDRVIADDRRSTIKFDWKPVSDFSPFTYVTASRDRIRKLDLKATGGVGAKWTFFRGAQARSKASFSLAGILDYEDFRLEAGSTEEETQTKLRWSARFKFDHAFASGATFQHVTFWQPQINGFGDYVVEMSNSVSTRLTSTLSLAIQHEYLHDEIPPPGAEPNDQKFSVVLRVSL